MHIDETPIRVGKEDNAGIKTIDRGYFWPILSAGIGVSFIYRASRSWGEVQTILKDFFGVLVSDAYEAYEVFVAEQSMRWQLCWMHIRRNFIEAEVSNPILAKEALQFIQNCYLLDLTKRITDPTLRAEDLTPANWKSRFFEEAVPAHLRDVIRPGEPFVGGPKLMSQTSLH